MKHRNISRLHTMERAAYFVRHARPGRLYTIADSLYLSNFNAEKQHVTLRFSHRDDKYCVFVHPVAGWARRYTTPQLLGRVIRLEPKGKELLS